MPKSKHGAPRASASGRVSSLSASGTVQTFAVPSTARDVIRGRVEERRAAFASVRAAEARVESCAHSVETLCTVWADAQSAHEAAAKLTKTHAEIAASSHRAADRARLAEAVEAEAAAKAEATQATRNLQSARQALEQAKADLKTARARYEAKR